MTQIAIDIDDTLYSFSEAARQVMRDWPEVDRHIFARAAEEPWREWDAAQPLCDNRFMEVIAKVHAAEAIIAQTPYPGVVDTLNRLSDRGHELTYISSRAAETLAPTRQWLRECGFPLGKNTNVICTYKDKTPLLLFHQYIIDDRCRTLVQFVYDFSWKQRVGEEGPRRLGFALRNDLNLGMSDVPGIHLGRDWAHLQRLLEDHTQLFA